MRFATGVISNMFVVIFHVLRVTCQQFKIFQSVIISDIVQVMDNLTLLQISTQIFLHNKSMFKNISSLRSKWMGWV